MALSEYNLDFKIIEKEDCQGRQPITYSTALNNMAVLYALSTTIFQRLISDWSVFCGLERYPHKEDR